MMLSEDLIEAIFEKKLGIVADALDLKVSIWQETLLIMLYLMHV